LTFDTVGLLVIGGASGP